MGGVRGAGLQHEEAGAIGAGDFCVNDFQVDFGMAEWAVAAIAGDRMGFNVNDVLVRVVHALRSSAVMRRMIAGIGRWAKRTARSGAKVFLVLFFQKKNFFLPFFLLSGCAAIPYGHPHAAVTSGVFVLADGVSLPYRVYPAQSEVRVVVLALHGYTDSRDAFVYLAGDLNPHGVTIYAPDQSSFGATGNRGLWPGTASLVEEGDDMARQLREKYPHTPLYVLGESMGGGVAILMAAGPHAPPVDGYVLESAAVWGGAALSPVYRGVLGLVDAVAPAKRLSGQSQHIRASDNIDALRAFGADPLTIHEPRVDDLAGLVGLMGDAQAACGAFHASRALFLYGGHDQLIPPEATQMCWARLPPGVTLAYYPADYHLMVRDVERATPIKDILNFVRGGTPVSGAPSAATVFLAGG
jgi:alpha-beta hydrolase superfamily lysophospholipase